MKKPVVISGLGGYVGTALKALLDEAGFEPVSVEGDITDAGNVEKEALRIAATYPQLSGLVHCVSAPLVRKPLLDESEGEFESQFRANVLGAFTFCKYFAPLLTTGSAVVGITTIGADIPRPNSSVGSYLAAKYGLKGLLRVLTAELKEKGIRVYAVAPAFMPGGLNADMPKAAADFIVQKSAPEDVTTPAEVAGVVRMLLSGDGAPESGVSVIVPGGASHPL
jgi:NAD(P)-dependent dehydrogenase (short-subunit alcohol dehydrogenase family)